MRIVLASDRLSTRGGADHYLLELMELLHSQGHELRLVVGRMTEDLDLSASIDVVRGLSPAIPSRSRLGGLGAHLDWADKLIVQNVMNPVALERLHQGNDAIFIVQDHRLFCPALGKTLPSGRACTEPMSEEICESCIEDADYRRRTLELTRARATAITGGRLVVLSDYMATELAQLGLGNARVIPPAAPVGGPGLPAEERAGYLLAGRLVSHKDPLQAVAAWNNSGSTEPLRVAGEGSKLVEMLEAAAGAEASLEPLGWLDRDAFQRELGRVRALLFPGLWQEPFGIVGLEALSMGTPVILSAGGGTPDWATRGCVRVEDTEGMARAIQELEADPRRAWTIGEQGRASVQARFSRTAFEKAWISALES
jgi:glycosyltransferase involved in cell wall biosynthesis